LRVKLSWIFLNVYTRQRAKRALECGSLLPPLNVGKSKPFGYILLFNIRRLTGAENLHSLKGGSKPPQGALCALLRMWRVDEILLTKFL
jgi:hypothetical protein